MGVCVELPAHVFDQRTERAAHRRYASGRWADGGPTLDVGGSRPQYFWNPLNRPVSQHAPDVSDQRLPAAWFAAEHGVELHTSVSEVADALTWLRGRHTFKMGLDWRWERLNVIQPPSPTGSFAFNALGSDLPGAANTGTPVASFLLGQVQAFSIDLQHSQIQERARFQEYFIQDDWKVSNRLTVNPGLRYTLNFPSTETTVRRPSSTCRTSS